MSLALTTIANDLEDLIQAREEVLAGEMCGACLGTATMFNPCEACNSTGQVVNTAALEMIEEAIKQYSQELLPDKVDAYWFTLKKIGKKDDSKPLSQQTGLIADAKREIKRLHGLIDQWDELRQMLNEYALEVMRLQNKKALEGNHGRKLRRQTNGGVEPVEITQVELIPERFMKATLTLTVDVWDEIGLWLGKFNGGLHLWHKLTDKIYDSKKWEPDLTAIREALLKREPCPDCELIDTATGKVASGRSSADPGVDICKTCGGETTVPCGVPGARLEPRGEHIRT